MVNIGCEFDQRLRAKILSVRLLPFPFQANSVLINHREEEDIKH
jgi:hypothetical protein